MGVIWTGFECGEKVHLQTRKHADHVCIKQGKHAGEKHECECGVTWTKDPELAGSNWSSEQVIYDSSNLPNNDNRNNKKKSNYN